MSAPLIKFIMHLNGETLHKAIAMSHSAQVHSIDAVPQLATAIRRFTEESLAALEDLGMDLQRALQWVGHDQKEYWAHQLRRAEQKLSEARINLERKRIFRVGDHEPACAEERKAVETAKRRLEFCREKLEAVRRWSRIIDQEATDCRGAVAPLAHWLEVDSPRARAMLGRVTGALESYVERDAAATAAPSPATAAPTAAEGTACDAPAGTSTSDEAEPTAS